MPRMSYSLWKQFYDQFRAWDYDKSTKTIMVDVPKARRKPFPKSWSHSGNHYRTPGGCTVYCWNTGFAENFSVERYISAYNVHSKTVPPGIDSREKVMKIVEEFERI